VRPSNESPSRLLLTEKLSYGLTDTGYNLVFNVASLYLMYYYTDVAGISLAAVGALFLVVRLLDVAAGPLAGALIDRTHTRWGKARPWFLWMTVPFAVIAVLTFTVPGSGSLVYVYVTYILFNLIASVNPFSCIMC